MVDAVELLKGLVERMELEMHVGRARVRFYARDALGNPAALEDAYGD
ncbi:MAG TPA: hypothetical protein VJB97_03470 [Candidatus Paceibacterota bacterium]